MNKRVIPLITGIFISLTLTACATAGPPPSPPSAAYVQLIELCGAGLDNSTKVGLSAQLQANGGVIDAGFTNSLRAGIMNLVSNLPANDQASTLQNLYSQYLGCLNTNLPPARQQEAERSQRHLALSCRDACCKQAGCSDDCAMQTIDGISVPVGDGSSCNEHMATKWGCTTYPNGMSYCGFMPVQVSYEGLRKCIANGCAALPSNGSE